MFSLATLYTWKSLHLIIMLIPFLWLDSYAHQGCCGWGTLGFILLCHGLREGDAEASHFIICLHSRQQRGCVGTCVLNCSGAKPAVGISFVAEVEFDAAAVVSLCSVFSRNCDWNVFQFRPLASRT
uniref:Putative secreted protein n=1 Tax=Amblyomma cajennense TaxID=34607 RepID=A0A023FCJ9_AMBCJ